MELQKKKKRKLINKDKHEGKQHFSEYTSPGDEDKKKKLMGIEHCTHQNKENQNLHNKIQRGSNTKTTHTRHSTTMVTQTQGDQAPMQRESEPIQRGGGLHLEGLILLPSTRLQMESRLQEASHPLDNSASLSCT